MDRKDKILSGEFFSKSDTCWNWFRAKSRHGYGSVWWNGKSTPAHRLVYELMVGEIPKGMTLDHLCLNKKCVNPSHLEVVSLIENIMRADGVCAVFARRTSCSKGHLYTQKNTYLKKGKWRVCKECKRKMQRNTRKMKRIQHSFAIATLDAARVGGK